MSPWEAFQVQTLLCSSTSVDLWERQLFLLRSEESVTGLVGESNRCGGGYGRGSVPLVWCWP